MKRFYKWLHEPVEYFWFDMMIGQGGWQTVPRWFSIWGRVSSYFLPFSLAIGLLGSMAIIIWLA